MNTVENTPAASRISSQMSPISRAILAYVDQHPNCGFQELHAIYCPDANSCKGAATEGFRSRLTYLTSVGYLKRTNVDGEFRYSVGLGERPEKPILQYAALPDADPAVRRTPAPQYDLMHAPQYVPEAGPAIRAGALDFKRHASVGVQC